jgi:hypothetical protein
LLRFGRSVRERLPAALRCNEKGLDAVSVERRAEMKRFLTEFFGRVHARAEIRRKRALHRAAREMGRDETHGGSIWRSGKGGSHPG